LGLVDDNMELDLNLLKIKKKWLTADAKDDDEITYDLFNPKYKLLFESFKDRNLFSFNKKYIEFQTKKKNAT